MKNLIFKIILCAILFVQCGNDKNNVQIENVVFRSVETTAITSCNAIIKIFFEGDNISNTKFGVEYWIENQEPKDVAIEADNIRNTTILFSLSDLAAKSQYFIRAYADLSNGERVYSYKIDFTTADDMIVETMPLEVVAKTGAICMAKLYQNRELLSEWGVVVSKEENPTIEDERFAAKDNESAVSADGDFGVFIDLLDASTLYYVRTYVVSKGNLYQYGERVEAGGIVYGNQLSFETTAGGGSSYTVSNHKKYPREKYPDEYDRIEEIMDHALFYLNNYCNRTKKMTVTYDQTVPTANANSAGWINFGGSMGLSTAQHEINHAYGSGTTTYSKETLSKNGKYVGKYGTIVCKVLKGDWSKEYVLNSGGAHFWPYGLNYATEVVGDISYKENALIMEAMRLDGMKS